MCLTFKLPSPSLPLPPSPSLSQLIEEDEGGIEVLQQVYDGAIDMLITELKSNAFKPKEYRKSRMFLPSTSQSSLGPDVHSNNTRR